MSDSPEILNITRYDSQDVWDCVQRTIPATEQILNVKIRYLVKPSVQSNRKLKGEKTWAVVRRPWGQVGGLGGPRRGPENFLEIALLHPDKLDLPPLVVIARAASDENQFAHSQIVSDLIEESASIFNTPGLATAAQSSDLKIKLHEKVAPEARKLAAFGAFKEQVKGRRATIVIKKGTLAGAFYRRDEAQQQIDNLQKKIPDLEAKQKVLEEELKRRTSEMLAPHSRLKD